MTNPVFNIPYKAVYTVDTEFQTQVNEKQKGREQRYPAWTFPKRTFTLKFDKNLDGRTDLENFFINVMGKAGKLDWVWDTEKGGNGQTYECWFDTDSFEQNIKDFGYTECELKLITIDRNAIQNVNALDFYHKVECNHNIIFNTLVDKIFTASNNRRSLWDTPKKSWTLTFEKNAAVRKQIEDFFIAKRGRFRCFQWKWAKEHGGDDNTYWVRFDSDSLSTDISEMGYSKTEVKLKEVFPNNNPNSEFDKDEIIPRKLLSIELVGGSIYVLDNETLEALTYEGQEFLGAPLSHGEIKRDDNSAVDKLSITLSNVSLGISGIIGARGDVITNAPAVLNLVFLNVNTNEIISGTEAILYAGKCNNLKLDSENATMDIETELGGFEKQAPVMKYRPTCQVRRFGDFYCGYTGTETKCDRTFTRCKELKNQGNFKGFPSCVIETVIKV